MLVQGALSLGLSVSVLTGAVVIASVCTGLGEFGEKFVAVVVRKFVAVLVYTAVLLY